MDAYDRNILMLCDKIQARRDMFETLYESLLLVSSKDTYIGRSDTIVYVDEVSLNEIPVPLKIQILADNEFAKEYIPVEEARAEKAPGTFTRAIDTAGRVAGKTWNAIPFLHRKDKFLREYTYTPGLGDIRSWTSGGQVGHVVYENKNIQILVIMNSKILRIESTYATLVKKDIVKTTLDISGPLVDDLLQNMRFGEDWTELMNLYYEDYPSGPLRDKNVDDEGYITLNCNEYASAMYGLPCDVLDSDYFTHAEYQYRKVGSPFLLERNFAINRMKRDIFRLEIESSRYLP